jgi:SAM-dependent methyltransferase
MTAAASGSKRYTEAAMAETTRHDAWQAGDGYERYMGRWSRPIAARFLAWLDMPAGLDWLDVGCGTGALSAAIVAVCEPRSLIGIDPSAGFVAKARHDVVDPRVDFRVGDAQALEVASGTQAVVVSALALNFVPDKVKALNEMRRVARPGGTIAFYVWDYPGGGVAFMRAFWQAAVALDPAARDLTEDRRFPFCTPQGLTELTRQAGLDPVECIAIESPAVFRDFDDFWQPFTLGAGPAPGYCVSLAPEQRERLRRRLEESLPRAADGSIALNTRAWALRTVAR